MNRTFTYIVLFVFLFGSTLHVVQIFSGYSVSESFNDGASIMLALSMPTAILACFRFLPAELPSFLTTAVYFSIFLIWGYFAYQLTTYSDYRISDVPGDIAFGWDWLMNNKKMVLVYFVVFAGITGLKRLGNASGHAIGDGINKSIGRSDNG